MLDTPCSEVVWRVLATHAIRQFPFHFPSRVSPCAITFQLDSTSLFRKKASSSFLYFATGDTFCYFVSRISSDFFSLSRIKASRSFFLLLKQVRCSRCLSKRKRWWSIYCSLINKCTFINLWHRTSCILGQAFHYSPENAFYIFNQQIYFIIWYLLDRASLI